MELAYPDLPLSNGVVTLRPWETSDAHCVQAASTDPRVSRGTTVPTTAGLVEALAFIDRQHGRLAAGEGVALAIVERQTAVGLVYLGRRSQPFVLGLGYWLVPNARGRGLAGSAVALATEWAFDALEAQRVEAWVEPANTASTSLLTRQGFTREGVLQSFLVLDNDRSDVVVYSRTSSTTTTTSPDESRSGSTTAMARTWLTIRVELLSGIYAECDPAPGRIFLVGPRHTFEQLARAINVGFARWDFSHLYDFELADGNVVGFVDEDFGEEGVLDHATTKVLASVKPGERFGYRFDFGDEWIHECTVEPAKVDPFDVYGETPTEPVALFGWGTIPDQYGRLTDGSDDETPSEPEIPFPFLHDEIVRIIELNDQEPMTSADLAATINAEGRYRKKDGSPMTASQISARINKYPTLFERGEDGRIGLRPRSSG